MKLEAREVSSDGQELREVLAWLPEVGETVFAARGRITPDPDGAMVELEDGTIVLNPRRHQRQIDFERMVAWLPPETGLALLRRTRWRDSPSALRLDLFAPN